MRRAVGLGLLVLAATPVTLAAQAPDSLAQAANTAAAANTVAINFVWTLVAGFLVMFMQAGFAMVETGFTRAKNAAHTMTMNFMVYGIAMLAYWAVGFAIQAGGVGALGTLGGYDKLAHEVSLTIAGKQWGLFGGTGFFLTGVAYTAPVFAYFLFQMVFMDTAATIPTGALAERWRFVAFVVFSVFVGAFIYPVYANWTWGGGWLSMLGKNLGLGHGHVDFAGSSVVHMTGGVMAFFAAALLGPRRGKYNYDGSANAIPGHNTPMVLADGTYGDGWNGVNGAVRGLFYGDAGQFAAQLVGGVTNFVAVGAMTYVAYKVTAVLVGGHRVAPDIEELGLDLPEMGALAYPDSPEVASAVILAEPADVSLGGGLEPEPEAA